MNLQRSAADEAFRVRVREFFARDYPRDILQKVRAGQRLTRDDHVRSQKALQSRGWFAVTWPAQFGGPGFTAWQRYLFDEELERAGVPNIMPMAVIYLGPVLMAFGTPEQQQRWLPDILESRALWAQGYSEPEAGSDLASLGLQAQRDGEDYVLNGTKIWTTQAHWADWMFCLVRTSRGARKQEGISFICVDMRTPGVRVHPLITMNGSHELNRVSFEDVRVPLANRVGDEGQGWHYANFLLQHERLSYAHIGRRKADVAELRRLAAAIESRNGCRLLDEPLFAARLASLEIEIAVLEVAVLRALVGNADSKAVAMLKIKCTECAQHVTELYLEAAGPGMSPYPQRETADWAEGLRGVAPFGPVWTDAYLFDRAQTIYGGTTEIQKNILWRSLER